MGVSECAVLCSGDMLQSLQHYLLCTMAEQCMHGMQILLPLSPKTFGNTLQSSS